MLDNFEQEENKRQALDAEAAAGRDLPKVRKEIDWSRGVEAIELDGIRTSDAPDFCDAFICYAEWADTGMELTDAELEELNSDSGFVYDEVIKRIY